MLDRLKSVNDVVINDNDQADPTGVLEMLEQQDMFAPKDAVQIIWDYIEKD